MNTLQKHSFRTIVALSPIFFLLYSFYSLNDFLITSIVVFIFSYLVVILAIFNHSNNDLQNRIIGEFELIFQNGSRGRFALIGFGMTLVVLLAHLIFVCRNGAVEFPLPSSLNFVQYVFYFVFLFAFLCVLNPLMQQLFFKLFLTNLFSKYVAVVFETAYQLIIVYYFVESYWVVVLGVVLLGVNSWLHMFGF